MIGPSLVEFDPVSVGPFEIARIPVSGAIAAAGFLLGLSLAVRQSRRAGLKPSHALELFAAGAPVVLLASRVPALVRAFPRFLHQGEALASALAARGSLLIGALAAMGLVAGFAWASREPLRFLDATAPAALVVAGAVAASHAARPASALLLGCGALVAAGAGMIVSERGPRPGVLAAASSLVITGLLLSASA